MTPHPVTVYRHRTQDNPACLSIKTQDMTPHPVSVYIRHGTALRHSIQTQDITPHPVTTYRYRTWHPNPSQYTETGHRTERHNGIHNYPFEVLGMTRPGNPSSTYHTRSKHSTLCRCFVGIR